MTFSIVARCKETGMLGTAITSSSPAVAARCSYTRSNIGAVSSQNITDPSLGYKSLDLLETGLSSHEVIDQLKLTNQNLEYRQLLLIDSKGQTAIYSGKHSLGIWSEAVGDNAIAAGNLLANKEVSQQIINIFEKTKGHLADRLLAALKGGLDTGGEVGPIHSAGIKISQAVAWPIIDLRCDWTEECPITNLQQAWTIYKPQVNDYLQRALDPSKAPSYGVPGDNENNLF
tara:strand:+ start:5283 stop:5972 length:690 start_codon:yes stop_codon:yes gene_type:complete